MDYEAYIEELAKGFSKDDTILLAELYKRHRECKRIAKRTKEATFRSEMSIREVSEVTGITPTKTRRVLSKLAFSKMAEMKKFDHSYTYAITRNGTYALKALLAGKGAPDRKALIEKVLED